MVLPLLAALAPAIAASEPAAAAAYDQNWAKVVPNWNRSSSPAIADVNGDGVNDIVMGHLDGYLRVLNIATGDVLPGWPQPAVLAPLIDGRPSAIESSPAVADLDGNGTNEIIVGVGPSGPLYAGIPQTRGGVMVFNRNGSVRCRFISADTGNAFTNSPVPDGISETVFSSPAIGDVDGDGNPDIVFGGFDLKVHAIDRNCNELSGFPVMVEDSTWSSPALYDADGDGRQEIFIGSDQSPGGAIDWRGGEFRELDWTPNGVRVPWTRRIDEVFHSSPAIGDIDGDGRMEVVTGAGGFWDQTGHPNADAKKIFAFHLDDGSNVAGWPQSTGGETFSSPAIGDITGDGKPEVVVGSNDGKIWTWHGNGVFNGSISPPGHPTNPGLPGPGKIEGSPILADMTGDGIQDIAFGNNLATYIYNGVNGAMVREIDLPWSSGNAPAVGDFGAYGRRLVTSTFDVPNFRTQVASYSLPSTTAPDAWPMFHKNARRLGAPVSDPPPPIWRAETGDGAGGAGGRIDADVGADPATIMYNGQPHVWFVDATNGNLRHGWWTGTTWMFETLDGAGGPNGRLDANVGAHPSVTLYGGQPHVWYTDTDNGNLRHGWWTGTTWMFETLDGAGGFNGRVDRVVGDRAAAAIYGFSLQVWYHDTTNGDLRHGWWTGSTWAFEINDGAGGGNGRVDADVGADLSVVMLNGLPHVFASEGGVHLRHAWFNGSAWQAEQVDGPGSSAAGGNGGTSSAVGGPSSALVYANRLHVWYSDLGAGNLRHAWFA